MSNTFLNTGRTVMATNNPQKNIEQAQSTSAQVPIQNNTSSIQQPQQQAQLQTNTQANTINPITIPIQIQPQVQSQTPRTQAVQETSVQAPKPQEYQGQNQGQDNVSFDQIYSGYQNNYNNINARTNNVSASGIKKSSIGTTIVTPTNTNLNTVNGMYQSTYSDTINGLISSMIEQLENGFQYDPNKDTALQVATEYASNSTMQSLAGSGVLNSSATAERVARVVSDLIPQYEQLAYTRWTDYLGQLSNTAQMVMNYDSQQFEYWKDAKDREFQNKQFEYQKQQDALNNAWKRIDELGYVDNNASAILGVPVGTLSGEARLAKEQREFELAKMREQAQIEYENNKALYQLKSELDKQQQEYTYQLEQKYGSNSRKSNSNNTTSLNTYKDIINNRWANYDDISKKYTVSDNVSLYNYLVSEYTAGRMSSSDLANLTAMYNVTKPTDSDIARQERIKYLNSLSATKCSIKMMKMKKKEKKKLIL